MTVAVAGAVLTGGRSRRMGVDKALVEVDGVPLAERVAAALTAGGCDPVVFVGGDAVALQRQGRPWHPDRWPGEGPVGGVLTALDALGTDVVVAACDLVDLDDATVAALLEAAAIADADVVVAETDRLEPLLAVWRASARAAVAAHFEGGERAAHRVVGALRAVTVPVDPRRLRNVNQPADVAARSRREV